MEKQNAYYGMARNHSRVPSLKSYRDGTLRKLCSKRDYTHTVTVPTCTSTCTCNIDVYTITVLDPLPLHIHVRGSRRNYHIPCSELDPAAS